MKALTKMLAGGVVVAAFAVATPASAQIFPGIGGFGGYGTSGVIGQVLGSVITGGLTRGYGYGGGYGSPYGYGGGYGSPYGAGSGYGYGYGSPYGYGAPYGGAPYGYGANIGYGQPYNGGGYGQSNQYAMGQCMGAVQQKLRATGYGANARVLGVSDVQRRQSGGTLVSGVANSGRTSTYGYAGNGQPPVDMTFTCKTDAGGNVASIELGEASSVAMQAAPPQTYGTDYSQYGYRRY